VAYLSYLLVPKAPLGINGWRWVVVIGCSGALIVWWLRRGLPESPRWFAEKGRVAEAERIVADLEERVRAESGRTLRVPARAEPAVLSKAFRDMWVRTAAAR
jgi:putative MFS transporter